MKQLDFTLSLIDNLTRPIKQAQSSVTGFTEKSQAAFKKIAIGGAGLFAAGIGIKDALTPAIEMHDALQAASAQGVSDATLKQVADNGMKFSIEYGKSALEFVQSTEVIKRSVSGLSEGELPRMTTITNTLAAALKGTAAETSEFMGQMFANFRREANAMGNVKFAEQIAGKAAYMRQAFGTEMAAIKDLMEGSKGTGTNFGVGMDEQFAVLGTLQRSLGSESSGAYESFLTGAAEGAEKLGLSFTDANGKLLSMPAMLEKLQGKYGASIEGNLQAQKELDEAFGGGAAVIKQLYGNVDVLQRHITELGSNDGLTRVTEMAEKMANPWDRLVAVWYAMRAAMGATLLPVLYPLINKLAEAGQTLVRWQNLFPNITRVIGYAVLALLSLAAAGAVANIVMGVSAFVMIGLQGIWKVLTTLMKVHVAVLWLYNRAVLALSATLRMLRGVLLAVRMVTVLTGVAFNFALWPVLLVIAAVAALVAGCYLLYQHLDQIIAAITQTDAFQVLAMIINVTAQLFSMAWAKIAEGWESVVTAISNFSLMDTMKGVVAGIGNLFNGLWAGIKASFAGVYGWIVEKLNHIPGVNIEMPTGAAPMTAGGAMPVSPEAMMPMSSPLAPQPVQPGANTLLTGRNIQGIERGGLNKEINSSNTRSHIDNSKHIGSVVIHANSGMTPEQLTEWDELR